jgi:hypothetical protein
VTSRFASFVVVAALGACEAKDPACGEVSMHVGSLLGPADRYTHEVEGAILGRCINDDWSAEVRRCLRSTTAVDDPKNCKAKLTVTQRAALDKEIAAIEEREAARVLPKACLDLEVQIAVAMSCETIPQAERDRIQKQFKLTKATWENVDNKALLAPTCGAAIAALKQATYECRPGGSSRKPPPSTP